MAITVACNEKAKISSSKTSVLWDSSLAPAWPEMQEQYKQSSLSWKVPGSKKPGNTKDIIS